MAKCLSLRKEFDNELLSLWTCVLQPLSTEIHLDIGYVKLLLGRKRLIVSIETK